MYKVIKLISRSVLSLSIVIISSFNTVFSDSNDSNQIKTNIGVYGGINDNMFTPNFKPESQLSNLIFNSNKSNLGLNFGAIGNFPLSKMFVISGRIGYNGLSGVINHSIADTNYELSSSLSYLELSPVLQIHDLLFSSNFYLLGGLEFGVPISKSYSLVNQKTNVNIQNGTTIPDPSSRFALIVGLGYMIPLGSDVYLTPELSYRLPFNNVSTNSSFSPLNVPQLRAGVALTFGLAKEEEKIKPKKEEEEKKVFDVSMMEIKGYNGSNSFPLKKITVKETNYEELYPVLPYIFYDKNQAEPNDSNQVLQTQPLTGSFITDQLIGNSLDINKHTLDIIGNRMNKYKSAHLTITGTNDGEKETKIKSLSMKRAEFAKNYLVSKHNIDAGRIDVKSRNLPENPSTNTDPDGIVENRRIEFTSTEDEVLAPISKKDSAEKVAEPDMVEFLTAVNSDKPIDTWTLSLFQGGNMVKTINGQGNPQNIRWAIQPNSLDKSELPVDWNLKVNNKAGESKVIQGSIPVDYQSLLSLNEHKQADKTIYKFSLVLFDFDKSDITPRDRKILEKNVIPVLTPMSKVNIYGFTDRIGTEEHNEKLSVDRAEAVKNMLQSKVNCNYQTMGYGESVKLFDNDSPIGRQLSRTVQVVVETPR